MEMFGSDFERYEQVQAELAQAETEREKQEIKPKRKKENRLPKRRV